ncbi:hypothetical protein BKA56DRAFT_609773 [Ilyonectria sp. MPI-CAGE-AT-0026]|nr:hypothetical protein BKA56DRAFT_609773 [Ilyonectria sp. MPI-CAGE-AT-0026]
MEAWEGAYESKPSTTHTPVTSCVGRRRRGRQTWLGSDLVRCPNLHSVQRLWKLRRLPARRGKGRQDRLQRTTKKKREEKLGQPVYAGCCPPGLVASTSVENLDGFCIALLRRSPPRPIEGQAKQDNKPKPKAESTEYQRHNGEPEQRRRQLSQPARLLSGQCWGRSLQKSTATHVHVHSPTHPSSDIFFPRPLLARASRRLGPLYPGSDMLELGLRYTPASLPLFISLSPGVNRPLRCPTRP